MQAGTHTWANNIMLRNYFVSSKGAVAKSDIFGLGVGDIVNYDTTP